MTQNPNITWTRIEDGYRSELLDAELLDNGPGLGSASGSGRWAVMLSGTWRMNVDTLVDAKRWASYLREQA